MIACLRLIRLWNLDEFSCSLIQNVTLPKVIYSVFGENYDIISFIQQYKTVEVVVFYVFLRCRVI